MTAEQPDLPFDNVLIAEKPKQAEPPYFENPANDNEKLLNYQYEFLKGDKKAFDRLYKLSVELCGKFISGISKTNPHVKKMPVEERKEKAHDAVCYIAEQYRRKKSWFISGNFPGYLYLRVLKELYGETKAQQIVDYVDFDELKGIAVPQKAESISEEKCVEAWYVMDDKVGHIKQFLLF